MISPFRIKPLMICMGLISLRYWWTLCLILDLKKKKNTTVILKFCSKLVSFYLSKGFLILYHKSDTLENVTLKVKKNPHVIDHHQTDSAMPCNRAIPYAVNTFNKIRLNSNLFDELSTNFYSKRSDIFSHIFKIFIIPSIDNSYHSEVIE